jgi:hypothetical protein
MAHRISRFSFLAALLTIAAFANRASGQNGFDAVANFSTNANPNGVWSYGWAASLGAPFQLVTTAYSVTGAGAAAFGWRNGLLQPNSCMISKDFTGFFTASTAAWYPDTLLLDPQIHAIMARFTAPSNANYQVSGFFRIQDTGTHAHDLTILANGNTTNFYVFTSGGSYTTQYPFKILTTLTQGETLDFIVSAHNNDYAFLSTGLACTLTSVTPPVVAILTPSTGGSEWACTPFTVTARASSSAASLTNLVLLLDGTNKLREVMYSTNTAVTSITAGVTLKTDALGQHLFTAKAADVFGAVTISNITVNIVAPPLHVLVADAFVTNSQCLLCMSGQVGHAYSILATTNFQYWTNIGIMQNVNGLLEFPDPDTTNYARRFYRALQQ